MKRKMHFLCFTLCLSLVQILAWAQGETRYPIVKDEFKKTMDGQTYHLAKINQKKGVIAQDGQTLAGLAKVGEVELNDFLKFNDLEADGAARAGVPYYFEKKAKYGQVHFHVLDPSETLWQVSQKYDLQMKYLLKYNHLKKANAPEVKPWLVVLLKSKRPRKMPAEYRPKPDPSADSPGDYSPTNPNNANPTPAEETPAAEDSDPMTDEFANAHADDPDFLNEENNDGTAHPAQPLEDNFYIVQEGDNLTTIARNLNISEDQIRDLNNIPYSQTTVPVGTKLRVKKKVVSNNTNASSVSNSSAQKQDPNYEYYDGKKGESLLEIARQFNCTEEAVRDWNDLPHTMRRLPEDMQLKLRIHPQVKDHSIVDIFPAPGVTKDDKLYPVYDRVLVGQDLAAFVYSLKNDSITVEKVRDWNNIPYTQSKMAAGTRLIIGYTRRAPFNPVDYPPLSVKEGMAEVSDTPSTTISDGRKPIYHEVKLGDSFSSLSSKYGITPEEIREWNKMPQDQRNLDFMDGKKIIVGFEGEEETSEPIAGEDAAPAEEKKPIYHTAKFGEGGRTLMGKYGITEEQIWEWNGLPFGTSLRELEEGRKYIVGYTGEGSGNAESEGTPAERKRETRKRMVYVQEGMKLQDVAGMFQADAMQIRELNGLTGTVQPTAKSYIAIKEHEVVFITDSTYSDTEQTFYIPSAEIVTDTAAAHLGVDVNFLYSLNGLGGEVIKLKAGIGYAILDKPDPTLVKEGAFPSLASGDTPPGDNSGLADNSTYTPPSTDNSGSSTPTPQGDYYYVKRGETLWGIAQNLGVGYDNILQWNPNLNPDKIDVDDKIRITAPADAANTNTVMPNASALTNGYHIVQLNESMYVLADQYSLKKTDLLAWNNITDETHIRVGDTLWLKDRYSAPVGYHIASPNENVYNLVAQYKLDKATFLRWNRLPGNTIDLEAGKQYIVDASKAPEINAPTTEYHTVQPGDSFHSIATKYNITVRQLKAWNNRKSDLLYKGEQIIVAQPADE